MNGVDRKSGLMMEDAFKFASIKSGGIENSWSLTIAILRVSRVLKNSRVLPFCRLINWREQLRRINVRLPNIFSFVPGAVRRREYPSVTLI